MNFEKKIKSMSAKQIILAMVRGLESKHVKVRMNTFGEYDYMNEICYGCAATNTICEITGVKFKNNIIEDRGSRSRKVGSSRFFIQAFEEAIDMLRQGGIDLYNKIAASAGFALIENTISALDGFGLPILGDQYTEADLDFYRLLAFSQPDKTKE